MLVFPCKGRNLFNLGGGDVARINTANASSFHVNFEHDLHGTFSVHRKKFLQDENDEIHGSEVVVEQQNRVERGRSELAALRLENGACLMLFGQDLILTSPQAKAKHR